MTFFDITNGLAINEDDVKQKGQDVFDKPTNALNFLTVKDIGFSFVFPT